MNISKVALAEAFGLAATSCSFEGEAVFPEFVALPAGLGSIGLDTADLSLKINKLHDAQPRRR